MFFYYYFAEMLIGLSMIKLCHSNLRTCRVSQMISVLHEKRQKAELTPARPHGARSIELVKSLNRARHKITF